MEFQHLVEKANVIRDRYAAHNKHEGREPWTASEYGQAFAGDVGDLLKLLMMKKNVRPSVADVDQKIAHELGDCLWALMMIAEDLGVDLEQSFLGTMVELEQKIPTVKE